MRSNARRTPESHQCRAGDALTFEATSGTCAYEKARANDPSKVPWTRIKPWVFRIEHLWPGPVAC